MIGTYNLSEETQKIADLIQESIEQSKESYKEQIKKFAEDVIYHLMQSVDEHFSYNCYDTYKQNVAYEVRKIITALLVGDPETIKQIDIVSDYTFDRLHEIRLKIWNECSNGIENSIIKEQQDTIDQLRKEIKFYRERF